jgi:hypothetical protein
VLPGLDGGRRWFSFAAEHRSGGFDLTILRAALAGLAVAALATSATAQPMRVPLDHSMVMGGVDVACTGIGQSKNDPKWQAYNVRIEFADAQSNYLAGETVRVDGAGGELMSISCEGPWVLLKLPVGQTFSVEGRATQPGVQPRTTKVTAPSHGQARFVLTFPDAH